MSEVMKIIQAVKDLRLNSVSVPTKKLAQSPTRFYVEFMPDAPFMVIPEVSRERRCYIPFAYLEPNVLASNKLRLLPQAKLHDFGVLASMMHMAWTRQTCGRMKSDFQYLISIVYNNFPWPESNDKQQADIRDAAQAVLDARAAHTMPLSLIYMVRSLCLPIY